MYGNFSSFGGYSLIFGLHKLFALAILLGLIFFVAWALKNLKKNELKKLAITLLAIGIAGCFLLTAIFGGFGHGFKDGKGYESGHSYSGAFKCIKDSVCETELNQLLLKRGYR